MPFIESIENVGEKQAMERGAKLSTNRIAAKMLKEGYTLEVVSKLTSLTFKEIEKLNK